MDSPRASQGPRNGPPREKLTDAFLRTAAVGTIADTIVPQLRARVAARVVSWQVVYWSRAVSGSRTYTIGRWPAIPVGKARDEARRVLAQAQLGQDPQRDRVVARGRAIADRRGLSVRQLSALVLGRLRRRPATLRGYRSAMDLHVLPRLGDLPAAALTRHQVRQLVAELARRHPYQANRVLASLRRVYSLGLEADLVGASPCIGVRAPGAESARERVYSGDELRKIWRGLLEVEARPEEPEPEPFAPRPSPGYVHSRQLRAHARAHRLALLTGCRRGEVYGARASEIDLEAGLWRLPAARTKAARQHLVPLSEPAVELLRAALAEARGGWLFPGDAGPLVYSSKAAALLRAATVPDLRMHDLRRTVATRCAEAGVPGLVVASLLGHRLPLPGATAVYLRHDYLAERRAALEAWAARLAEIGAG